MSKKSSPGDGSYGKGVKGMPRPLDRLFGTSSDVGSQPQGNVGATPSRFPMLIGLILLLAIISVGVYFVRRGAVRVPASGGVDLQVAEAAVAGDWDTVGRLLSAVDEKTASPALRLLAGHARLRLNRNNDALRLFLSVSAEGDLKQWKDWADEFARLNPRRAVAHYFLGDALMRQAEIDAAIASFDRALETRNNDPLALNARGTAYAAKSEWDRATTDLDSAIQADARFAEACASRGAMMLQKKAAFEGAEKWFNRALEISPDFTLALYNRGLTLGAQDKWEQGRKDIEAALAKSDCLKSLAQEDLMRIAAVRAESDELAMAGASKEQVGTTIDRQLDKVARGDVGALNPVARLVGHNPDQAAHVNQRLAEIAQSHPNLAGSINNKIYGARDWTSETGGAKQLFNLAQGANMGGSIERSRGAQAGVDLGALRVGVSDGTRGTVQGGIGFATWAAGQIDKTSIDNRGWNTLQFVGPRSTNPVGGVTTNLASAHIERGDWPIVAHYGLAYRIDRSEGKLGSVLQK